MNLQSTDFELLGVPMRFEQDGAVLMQRWKTLQAQVHPDRFAQQGAHAQRLSMQWSARINEAYQRLKNPLQRAAYLCELHQAPIQAQTNTHMPAQFLMEQMHWREALEQAQSLQALQTLERDMARKQEDLLQQCQHDIDVAGNFEQAAQHVRAWMFVQRFAHDIEARMEQIEPDQTP